MKKWLYFILDLIRAAACSARTGRGFAIVEEEDWLERVKETNVLDKERRLMWDCIDNMIHGGEACAYCDHLSDCLRKAEDPIRGCDCWTLRDLTDEEVRDCEPAKSI